MALILPVALVITAAVADFGLARIQKNKFQNYVDSAALAAVPELPDAMTPIPGNSLLSPTRPRSIRRVRPCGATAKSTAAVWAFNNLQIGSYLETTCDAGYDPANTKCYTGEGQEVIVTSPYYGTVVGSHSPADLVHVEACKDVATTFARLISLNTLTVCADATAVTETVGGPSAGSCGFCLIGEGNITGLEVTGSAAIAVLDGSIHANSSSSGSAIKSSSSGPDGGDGSVYMSCSALDTSVTPPICTPSSDANAISMVGGHGMDAGETNPWPPATTQDVIPDPLASIPYPTHVVAPGYPVFDKVSYGGSDCPVTDGECWLNPGVYNEIGGGSGTIRLNPGIYVITSKLKLGNTPDPDLAYTEPGTTAPVSLWGKNVLIFLSCGDWPTPCADGGESGGEWVQSSGSGVFLTAPDGTDPTTADWQGIVIMADRNNDKPQRMTGSGFMSISGAMYFASAPLLLTGSTSIGSAYSMIVAHTAKLTGSSLIMVNYDPNVLPPILGGGASQPSGLVE